MPRYIDADSLMRQLNRKKAGTANKRYTEGFNDALMRFRSMVSTAPTVSSDEVRGVGEWIKYAPHNSDMRVCSACEKYWILDGDQYDFRYCPSCGARMSRAEAEKAMEVSDDE